VVIEDRPTFNRFRNFVFMLQSRTEIRVRLSIRFDRSREAVKSLKAVHLFRMTSSSFIDSYHLNPIFALPSLTINSMDNVTMSAP
jgi:hypothetical protein